MSSPVNHKLSSEKEDKSEAEDTSIVEKPRRGRKSKNVSSPSKSDSSVMAPSAPAPSIANEKKDEAPKTILKPPVFVPKMEDKKLAEVKEQATKKVPPPTQAVSKVSTVPSKVAKKASPLTPTTSSIQNVKKVPAALLPPAQATKKASTAAVPSSKKVPSPTTSPTPAALSPAPTQLAKKVPPVNAERPQPLLSATKSAEGLAMKAKKRGRPSTSKAVPSETEGKKSFKAKDDKAIVEDVNDDDKDEEDDDPFKNVKGRKGKIGRKVVKLLEDVEKLIAYQEQQRRLRNRTLLDLPEAIQLMQKYKAKKKTKTYTATVDEALPLKISLKRQRSKPQHTIQKMGENGLKFKLLRKTDVGLKAVEAETVAPLADEQPQNPSPSKSPLQAVVSLVNITDDVSLKPKKRGRPPKKAAVTDDNVKEQTEETNQALVSTNPADTIDIIEPQAKQRKTDHDEDEEALAEQKQAAKRRGRPPKKAIIAEFEAAAAAAAAAAEAEAAAASSTAETTQSDQQPFSDPVKIIHQEVVDEQKNLVKQQTTKAVIDSQEDHSSVPPAKKRGRPKRPVIESKVENLDISDDVIAKEPIEDEDILPANKRKRGLRERKAMSMAEDVIGEPFDNDAVDDSLALPQRSEVQAKNETTKDTKPIDEKLLKNEEVKRVTTEMLRATTEMLSAAGSELAKKSSRTAVDEASEINDNRYVVQSVATNPLKIKLKTGLQETSKDKIKAPLKLKVSLRDCILDPEGGRKSKSKKHKKKKTIDKSPDAPANAGDKPQIILRIKSPTNNQDDLQKTLVEPTKAPKSGGGNNGYLVKAGADEPGVDDRPRAPSSASDHGAASMVTFSPESSPEHNVRTNFFMPQESAEIGLGEGQFKDLMKAIDSDVEAVATAASSKTATPPKASLSWLTETKASTSSAAAAVAGVSSVKQSQVDGTIDTWSRSSSISQSASPIHMLSAEESSAAEDSDFANDNLEKQQSVIHKRMKQIQNRPKSKSCLIKHVFSAVAKKRKIVVVRYRKPEQRIFDLDEYVERSRTSRLDEPYDEDVDDPTLIKQPKTTSSKQSSKSSSGSSSWSPSRLTLATDEDDSWRNDPDCLESLETLSCVECSRSGNPRSFPNKQRMHAHLQMHLQNQSKSKSKPASSKSKPDQLEESAATDHIIQLDGANDLFLDGEGGPTLSATAVTTPTPNASGAGPPPSATTHLYILKSQDAKVYQCSQCPEVFPGQKALLTHQSLVHRNSLTSTIFPCQQCSIGFKDAKSLDQHMRHQHGKQQIVTIIQADLPRDSASTGSSSCSSSTTSSHPSCSSSSSGYFTSQSDTLGGNVHGMEVGGGDGGSSKSSHPLLMKQDPVLMFNSDEEQDLMLDESLNLFETSSLIDSGDSAIHLSLDDLANFAQPMVATDGSHNSFDTSIETSSFLSGADALDIINDANSSHHAPLGGMEDPVSSRNTATSGSRTPSVSDDGEFPCSQCDKRFGNRRNLLSHMRRHTGDFKLFCDHCSKGFFTQSKLESHKRKHTGKKHV